MPSKPVFARKGRALLPGQRSELTVIDADGSGRQVVFVADEIIEAPNWTPDGKSLIFNAGGEIWRIAADGRRARPDRDRHAARPQQRPRALARRQDDLS